VIRVCGAAGQGIQTIGATLARVFARSGFYVFSYQDYESRVRGGHNFYEIRFSDRLVSAPRGGIDLLIALDRETLDVDAPELLEGGIGVYDSKALDTTMDDDRYVDVPFNDIAQEQAGSRLMANTVASGAALGMLGMPGDVIGKVVEATLGRQGSDVVEKNRKEGLAGHTYAKEHCPKCAFTILPAGKERLLIAGNEAVGFAAMASGVKFYAAYPMTPSTGIITYLAGKAADHGMIVEQAEDEISAINMALGASFMGVRSMTGTSGGGFALMVEGISLAGMTETPVVIVLGQRPGPATGLPTRTEQADLLFALFAAHGEFPRLLFAPGNPEQIFSCVNRAFDLAEKYQVPAIVLTDQLLADAEWSLDGIDLDSFVYNDYRVRGDAYAALPEYKRHALTETGVSPLAVPGDATHVVVTDSDEHSEEGHIIEDAATRKRMVEKRMMKKMPLIRGEMVQPELFGADEPDTVLCGWGSNWGVLREVTDRLNGNGKRVAMLHFSELYPFPEYEGRPWMEALRNAKKTVCIENNATGRFAYLFRAETGFVFSSNVGGYDGRPFNARDLERELSNGHLG
jgi:2-oxoglutarate ferredoxin oxidoreductase subunit alpha